ncbi:hypothetical protein [Deinococcus cellulosilyticus]|uniref:Uncharacterized protein n=1 Tax=Deinococcus cellulosilyticus (strain DSM 18568 / NBRC 106333 / KACC 11606 / 5516J-15) TaxID=1223518 RepID=A0A511N5H0_DEIC1|nr:hypothetical protein [Deinococcus cellulosilyticus]GEM47717.1 hypothetical protein DC3_33520 [Deinococcus cellulosilyticus NBRC 106333 = KACC 11606]
MSTYMHIIFENQKIHVVLPIQQANALAWSFITCLSHQITDQAEQVLGVGQKAATDLVLHFRDQIQKHGEVTLDLQSFQVLQKLVHQVHQRKIERDEIAPPVLESLAGFDASSEVLFSVDLVRESLDEVQKPTFDVLKRAFPDGLTPEQEIHLVALLDEDDFSQRSIGSYLSALRGQFTFGNYIQATHDAVGIIIDHAWTQEDVERMRDRVNRVGYS